MARLLAPVLVLSGALSLAACDLLIVDWPVPPEDYVGLDAGTFALDDRSARRSSGTATAYGPDSTASAPALPSVRLEGDDGVALTIWAAELGGPELGARFRPARVEYEETDGAGRTSEYYLDRGEERAEVVVRAAEGGRVEGTFSFTLDPLSFGSVISVGFEVRGGFHAVPAESPSAP